MRPLIIISFDGLAAEDIEYLQQKPTFSRFLNEASGSHQVKSIYPSVTYAAHASIITGCYPNRHGIVDNTKNQPSRYQSPDWYWYRSDIKKDTLYDIAKKNGYKTAALLWPTTGRANIDYNLPEIFSNRKWTSQIMISLYAGTPSYQIDLNRRFGKIRKGKYQPMLDHFTTASAVATIRERQPDMLMIHLTDLDAMRHMTSHFSEDSYAALDRHEERLTRFLYALSTIAKYDDAIVAILGDHSSIDVTHGISMNTMFKSWGYLNANDNAITEHKVIAKSCDGSCYIYLKDIKIAEALLEKLTLLQTEYRHAFKIIRYQDIQTKGADAKAFLMLEALPPYHFVDDLLTSFIKPISDIPYYQNHNITACHGFDPNRSNYSTVFYVKGKGIRAGVDLGTMSLVDIAPTLAEILGFNMNNIDGESVAQKIQDNAHEVN